MGTPVYEPTIFGRIVDADDVEQWCLQELRIWAGTYLAEKERQKGLEAGYLQRPRSWQIAPSFDNWPEDQVPGIIVQSVGLAEAPLKDGRGSYRARWEIGLGCVVSARTQEETHRMAGLYVAAFRALLIQRPSLGGRAAGVVWQDEDYTQLLYDDLRTLGAGMALFTVEVEDVTSWGMGPNTPDVPNDPDTDPWPAYPIVLTHEEQVEHYPPPEELPTQRGGADAPRS
jgi:hypothetical protein